VTPDLTIEARAVAVNEEEDTPLDAGAGGAGAGGSHAARARYGPSFVSKWAILAVWLGMAGLFAVIEPSAFLQIGTLQTIFGSQEALIFISLGLLATLIAGEFDRQPALGGDRCDEAQEPRPPAARRRSGPITCRVGFGGYGVANPIQVTSDRGRDHSTSGD
jgi:hypothetical protein